MGLEIKSDKPPKRPKIEATNNHHNVTISLSTTSSDQDKSIYNRNKAAMKRLKQQERSSKTALFLMGETLPLRQK